MARNDNPPRRPRPVAPEPVQPATTVVPPSASAPQPVIDQYDDEAQAATKPGLVNDTDLDESTNVADHGGVASSADNNQIGVTGMTVAYEKGLGLSVDQIAQELKGFRSEQIAQIFWQVSESNGAAPIGTPERSLEEITEDIAARLAKLDPDIREALIEPFVKRPQVPAFTDSDENRIAYKEGFEAGVVKDIEESRMYRWAIGCSLDDYFRYIDIAEADVESARAEALDDNRLSKFERDYISVTLPDVVRDTSAITLPHDDALLQYRAINKRMMLYARACEQFAANGVDPERVDEWMDAAKAAIERKRAEMVAEVDARAKALTEGCIELQGAFAELIERTGFAPKKPVEVPLRVGGVTITLPVDLTKDDEDLWRKRNPGALIGRIHPDSELTPEEDRGIRKIIRLAKEDRFITIMGVQEEQDRLAAIERLHSITGIPMEA